MPAIPSSSPNNATSAKSAVTRSAASKDTGYGSIKTDENGRTKIAPLVDGIDLNAQIEEIKQANLAKAQPWKDKLEINHKKIPAILDIKNKTAALEKTLQCFSGTLKTFVSPDANVFNKKIVNKLSGDNSVEVSATSEALITINPIKISVQQLASCDEIKTKTSKEIASITNNITPMGLNGDLVINGTPVSITNIMTFQNICDTINSSSSTSNVTASLLKISDDDGYKLILRGKEMATAIDFFDTNLALLNSLGLSGEPTDLKNLIAKFNYNGENLTRNSNTITDILDNVRFTLNSVTQKDGSINSIPNFFMVSSDDNNVYDSINNIVETYNELNKSILEYSKPKDEDDDTSEPGILINDLLIFKLKNLFEEKLLSSFPSKERISPKNFFEGKIIGIEYDNNNNLIFDQNVLIDTIANNFQGLKNLFTSSVSCNNSNFAIYSDMNDSQNAIFNKTVTVTYAANQNDNNYTATLSVVGQQDLTVNLETVYHAEENRYIPSFIIDGTTDNNKLKGTVYEGLTIQINLTENNLPASGTSIQFDFTLNRKLGDALDVSLKNALLEKNPKDLQAVPLGFFDAAIDIIKKQDNILKVNIDRFKNHADMIEKRMIIRMQYVYEASIKADAIMDMIKSYKETLKHKE